MASLGVMPERQQWIAFGIVTCAASGRQIIPHGAETADGPLYAVARLADQIDRLAFGDFESHHIVFVHKDDLTRAVDTAQTILVTVDSCVELVVAPYGD
jgi:hypothetical protein